MKKLIAIIVILAVQSGFMLAQDTIKQKQYRTVTNNAFTTGEKLTYEIGYGFLTGGYATLNVDNNTIDINGRKCLNVNVNAHSASTFEIVYKFKNDYKCYIDQLGIFPWIVEMDKSEGDYTEYKKSEFDQNNNKINVTKKVRGGAEEKSQYSVSDYTLDEITAFYYSRTLDFSNKQPGDVLTFNVFMGDNVKELKVKYLGKEDTDVPAGEFRCFKVQPLLKESELASKVDDVFIYITDDANKIPGLVQMKIVIGSIKVKLTGYQGLANPLTSKID